MSALWYIFIFYIGFYFYRLAENYNRNKWLYGAFGILFYFVGFFVHPLYVRFFVDEEFDKYDISIVSIKSLITGFLFVFILFHLLDFIWKKKEKR